MNSFENKSFSGAENIYQELLLQKYVPPCLLVNQKEEVLWVNFEAGKYLSAPNIMPGQLLSGITDEAIRRELLKGIKEILQGEESVFIDGRTLHERYIFYIYLTPVVTQPLSEKLVLIEFEDTYAQTVKVPGTRHAGIDFQKHFDEFLRTTEHDIRNMASSFVMLLKFEESRYSNKRKITDVNKMEERFLSNLYLNLNKLIATLAHYLS